MKFEVLNRWSSEVQFTAEIECADDTIRSAKLGLAVKWALGNKADLCSADLYGADIRGANLCSANLRDANLRGANLCSANLCSANLCSADLCSADLRGADLRGANLRDANLRGANLRDANLRGADLYGADLYGADIRGAKSADLAIARTRILPEGQLIGWKKTRQGVVKLSIPADSPRSHAFGRKCRCREADVIELPDGVTEARSFHDNNFVYRVGERVTCYAWEENWQVECGGGIHFYLTKIEAEHHD